VTGWQTSVNAVGGDVVNFTCYIEFYGNVIPSLHWSKNSAVRRFNRGFNRVILNGTINWEDLSISVEVPDGPATVSYTCRPIAEKRKWANVYFWQSTSITVSC